MAAAEPSDRQRAYALWLKAKHRDPVMDGREDPAEAFAAGWEIGQAVAMHGEYDGVTACPPPNDVVAASVAEFMEAK